MPNDRENREAENVRIDIEVEGQIIRAGLCENSNAPINEASGADARLPEFCATRLNTDNSPIIIRRGESGYWPGSRLGLVDDETIEAFNKKHGASAGAVKAMEFGSMFGWHTPGATLEAGEDMARRAAAHAGDKA